MNKSKLPGGMTFMLLNRLHVRTVDYPKDNIQIIDSYIQTDLPSDTT